MKYRKFSKSKQLVSEIGQGTWTMGGHWGPRDDAAALASLRKSFECGINFFDTAWIYGDGHSEHLIGSAFKGKKAQEIFVATKIPPKNLKWPARHGQPLADYFPPDHIVEYTEKSLKNLRRETIELQQLHVWSDTWMSDPLMEEVFKSVEKLKSEGKIKYFGVSINDHDPASALKITASGLIDCVQVIYNIFDQSPEDELFPLCLEKNIAVIARVPFDEGSLCGIITPGIKFHSKDWRRYYFTPERIEEIEHRLKNISDIASEENISLPALALKYCLSHPAVTTVIPGMRKIEHVIANSQVSDLPDLKKTTLEKLKKERWIRNFYPTWGD